MFCHTTHICIRRGCAVDARTDERSCDGSPSGFFIVRIGHHVFDFQIFDRDEAWEEKLDEVQTYLYQYVDDIGGLPSAEHAIGLVKKPYFKQVMSDTFIKVAREKTDDFSRRMNRGISDQELKAFLWKTV